MMAMPTEVFKRLSLAYKAVGRSSALPLPHGRPPWNKHSHAFQADACFWNLSHTLGMCLEDPQAQPKPVEPNPGAKQHSGLDSLLVMLRLVTTSPKA